VERAAVSHEVSANGDPGAAGAGGEDNGAPRFDVVRPADGSVIESVAIDSPDRVREVVARVRSAQPAWEALGFEGRRIWMERLRDWLLANQEEITDLMQAESGKVRADAGLEVPHLCDMINYYADAGAGYLADEEPSPHLPLMRTKRLKVVYRPYPVVGLISPWNFPLILSAGDAIPAMFAGAAVVVKPSEITPLCFMELVRAWREDLGAPDVLDCVNGMADTGGALVDEVDFIGFTGSERTGKAVMKRAAETLTPVSLELGGKDPMIVTRDADVERAANAAAFGGLLNTGQICLSVERVYVEEPIYDEFVSRLTDRVKELRQGADGRSYSAEIGAMTAPTQTDIVAAHVDDARESGARILTGGKRREGPGDFYEPTVIADAEPSMKVMREETFGPVIPVMKVPDVDEAVRLANDTTYGLGATVFAGDVETGERIARRIEAGACDVNDVLAHYNVLEIPMGGWKHSGIGVRHGPTGIRKYCRTESITVPRLPTTKSELIWYPYTKGKRRLISRLYRFFNARGLRNRLGL
jgi:acyl-CoA reductase-like NAD-dependent aldehyde dehydrogenase